LQEKKTKIKEEKLRWSLKKEMSGNDKKKT